MPGAERFDSGRNGVYTGYNDVKGESVEVGYVAIRSADGYAGPVTIGTGMDKDGSILNAVIVRQTESAAFFRRVLEKGYPAKFKGKKCTDEFVIGGDVDSVTGATVSLEAVSKAAHKACADIAAGRLGLPPIVWEKPKIQFGLSEIILILLIVAGFAASGKKFPAMKYIKWIALAGSMVFIGFVYKWPASLININSLLVGYLPNWQNHIYWYLLGAAILLPVILKGKTPYCSNICPFGAMQEILVTLGGKRRQMPGKWLKLFRILQRILAWTAVMCALVFRNPALVSYDVPVTLFTLIGQNWQFVLLALFVITSLFVVRPWCNCLCPLRAVFDYIRLFRRCLVNRPTGRS